MHSTKSDLERRARPDRRSADWRSGWPTLRSHGLASRRNTGLPCRFRTTRCCSNPWLADWPSASWSAIPCSCASSTGSRVGMPSSRPSWSACVRWSWSRSCSAALKLLCDRRRLAVLPHRHDDQRDQDSCAWSCRRLCVQREVPTSCPPVAAGDQPAGRTAASSWIPGSQPETDGEHPMSSPGDWQF